MGEKQEGDKKNEGEKKSDGGGSTIVVMKFDMHCEGCAKKVRKSLKNFNGVENVKTESSAGKLTVVGKVDPEKLKAKVEEKTKKKVEILSLQPNKPSNKDGGDEKKSDEKKSEVKSDNKKSEDKIEEKKPKEPQVANASLKTRVHCDGCAQKIKKIIRKCDGVQEVNVDLQKDLITVKGTMDINDLLPYLNIKLKRNVELASAKKDEGGGGDKKPKDGGGPKEKPKEGGGGGGGSSEKPAEKKEGGGGSSEKAAEKKEGGGGEKKDAGGGSSGGGGGGEGSAPPQENVTKIEVNKMEYNPYGYGYGAHAYTYDPRQQMEGYSHQVVDYWHEPDYSHPPQMFSDENPNACSVM